MGEIEYINLVKKVLLTGETRSTRNSDVLGLFGEHLSIDIGENSLPRFTTKNVSFKNVFEELMFFIRGETNSKILEEKGINIWKGNTSRKFLDNLGLDYEEGDMGPMYGFQWNHFGAEYNGCDHDYSNQGYNQLDNCIYLIKNDPSSRRIMFTAFDPSKLHQMVLAPCHTMFQFYVRSGKYLDGQLYQRSADLMLGVPYNILSYSLLITMIARFCGLIPGTLKITFGDVHIYKDHLMGALEQIKRKPANFPTIKINNSVDTPIRDYKYEDFEFIDYNPLPNIKMRMIA